MQYLLLIHDDEKDWEAMPEGAQNAMLAEYGAYTEDLRSRGLLVGANQLQPGSTATTVSVRDGGTVVTDGPFAETKELIAGFDILECDSLDEALEIAAGHPVARFGAIDVRAFWAD